MHVAILNHAAKVSQNEAELMVRAVRHQIRQHVCPLWGRFPPSIALHGEQRPDTSAVLVICDDSDQAGALGYHAEDTVAWGRVFVDPVLDAGGGLFEGPEGLAVSAVLSHEVIELMLDPYCNAWVEDDEGREYAMEACDPVEADAYPIPTANPLAPRVMVSSFILPAWADSDPREGAKFDYMGKLAAPFTMTPGGYMIVREAPGQEKAVYGASYAAWRRAGKASPISRSSQRGLFKAAITRAEAMLAEGGILHEAPVLPEAPMSGTAEKHAEESSDAEMARLAALEEARMEPATPKRTPPSEDLTPVEPVREHRKPKRKDRP